MNPTHLSVFDCRSGLLKYNLSPSFSIGDLACNESVLVAISDDNSRLVIWNSATGQHIEDLKLSDVPGSVSPNHTIIIKKTQIAITNDNTLILCQDGQLNSDYGQFIFLLSAMDAGIRRCIWVHDDG